MKKITQNKPFFFFILIILLWSCGGSDGDPSTDKNSKDRKAILTHWADNIIKPSYANFKLEFDVMVDKADVFTAAPNSTSLSEFRAACVDAYTEWQKTELLEFGPASKYTLRNFYNIYPADVAGIHTNINTPTANLEVPAAYPRQGFPALDYLLNGTGEDDDAILAYYTDETEGTKRLAYITRLVTRMNTLLTNVITEWNGSYRDAFISDTGLDIGSSTGLVVNAYVLSYERYVRSGKIGIPSGAMVSGGGSIQPSKVEAYYKKDISRILAKTANQAAHDFFTGKNVTTGEDGPSFKSYLDALDARDQSSGTLLSALIDEQFEIINTEVNQLGDNFSEEVETNNEAMTDTFTEMQKMVRLLKVDMTSAMSITITYTDNDGD